MHDLEQHHPNDNLNDNLNDNSGFWDNMPESRLDRWRSHRSPRSSPAQRNAIATTQGGRQHGVDPSQPTRRPTGIVGTAAGRVRQATEHVDPLLRRTGAVAIIIAALVPVALSMRSSHTSAAALVPAATTPVHASPSTTVALGVTTVATPAVAHPAQPHVAVRVSAHLAPHTTVRVTHAAVPSRSSSTTIAHVTAPSRTVEVATRAAARTCTNTYRLVAGDAWILIAGKAHVSLKALLAANQASASTALYPGRKICLPAGARVTHPVSHASVSHASASHASVGVAVSHQFYAPPRAYTPSEVEHIIRQVWPKNLADHAVLIARRESNLVPTARNFCCSGLFQIYYSVHAHWLSNYGITNAQQLLDPRTNAYAALLLYYRSGGFGPWGG
ncbi:MAG: LysM peptidoglycan-binding domain-containing protein [Actinomycetota bacterium]